MAVVRAQNAARWCGPGVAAHVDEKASATELAAASMAGRDVRLGSEASTRRGMEKREREREREREGGGAGVLERRGGVVQPSARRGRMRRGEDRCSIDGFSMGMMA
jgi:hypothetical protein